MIHDISSEYLVLSGVLINEAGYRQCIFSSKRAPLAEAFNRMHTHYTASPTTFISDEVNIVEDGEARSLS